MTILTNWYPVDNKLGVNFNSPITISSASNPDYPAAPFALGERVQGNAGSEWIYVQVSTTCSAFDTVVIDSTFKANPITSALVASNVYSYGVAEFQPSLSGNVQIANANDFMWALLKANGGVGINITGSAGRGAALYINASNPGKLTATVTTGNRVNNVMVVTAQALSATSTPAECVLMAYMQPSLNLSSSA